MEWLFRKAEEFLQRHRWIRRWRKVLAVLMVMVVFMSTYAMVLPAITLETGESTEIGLFADTPADESTLTDSTPEAGAEGTVLTAETVTPAEAAPAEPAPAEPAPAETTPAEIIPAEETPAETVPAETIPADDVTPAPSAEDFSTVPEEAENPDNDEPISENSSVEQPAAEEPSDEAVKSLVTGGADYTVTMTFTADAKIPDGAVLSAKEILPTAYNYEGYFNKATEALNLSEEQKSNTYARFFDIRILIGAEEVTPEAPVQVEITYNTPQENSANAEMNAVHFGNEGPEVIAAEATQADEMTGEVNAVGFEAGSFSVYGVVYTVDFHYEVNGQVYEFGMPGGGFLSFYGIIESLGVANSDADSRSGGENPEMKDSDAAISEETRKFTANVASVEFSSPELVWVGKVNEETTVGALKEANGLEVISSADLTEEQIEEINGSTVEAGDWALISMQPFESEETLTVTMKDGEVFTVRVTDEQISTRVITADGQDYVITLTYRPEAGIPAGATLEAAEIVEGSSKWMEYYDQAAEAVGEESLAFARFFDIKIISHGEEIEPKAPVETKIEYDSCIPLHPDSKMKAVHFASNGVEVLDVNLDDEEFVSEVTFEQGSFSVTGTVVSELAEGQYLIYGYDVTYNGRHYTDKSYTNNPDWAYRNVTQFDKSYYSLQYNNGLSAVQLDANGTAYGRAYYTGSNNTRVLWTVTKSGDGYLISNNNRYLRDNNGTLAVTNNAGQATVWTYQNGQLTDGTRYLVYNRSTGRFELTTAQPVGSNIYFAWNNPNTTNNVTIHYMLDNGDGTYTQSSEITLPLQNNSINRGAQYDLRQGIPSGMQYQKTYVTDMDNEGQFSGSGTEIHYFLQTNYGLSDANINNTSYRGWLYRETTSADFDYGVNGWPSNGGIAVTTVSAYRSFGDERDIYVTYRKPPEAASPTDPGAIDAEAPKINKDKIDNEDGTYDIDLSVTGSANSSQVTTKANVAVILDLSYSMLGQDTDVSGQSRLDACKAAIRSLASQLFELNEDAPGTIEAAYIGFAQRVLNEREINTTYADFDSFMAAVNKSTTAAGTNWDAALEAVNNIQWSDGDPVYVIFVTDGQPNSYSNATSPSNGNNSYWDSGNYNVGNSASNAGNAAVTAAGAQVTALKNAGATVYGIGAFINSATDKYFVDQINIDSDKHFKSNDTAALNENITKIVSEISSSVGYQNVTATDGLTGMTQTALVNGNAGNFTYTVAKYTEATEKLAQLPDGAALGATKDEAGNITSYTRNTGTDSADYPYIKTVKTVVSGSEAAVTKNNDGTLTIRFPDSTSDTVRQASYADGSKTVTWDFGENYQLRDGYTYTVSFTVWPNQASYDLLAALRNGLLEWGNDFTYTDESGAQQTITFADYSAQIVCRIREQSDLLQGVLGDPDFAAFRRPGGKHNRSGDRCRHNVHRQWERHVHQDGEDPGNT